MSETENYEVFAIRYADRPGRTRQDSFLLDPLHHLPHPIDYYIWLLRSPSRTILVDTGYDQTEADMRGRGILIDPAAALAAIGVDPASIDTVIITHLHYDHAGGMAAFPNAEIHIQTREMSYATGPCMCHDILRGPYSAVHVCEAVRRLYTGKLRFHDGAGEVAPGVSVHLIGGHTGGIQCVRVQTAQGPLVLASDTAAYYESFEQSKPFPLVVDVYAMLEGYAALKRLAGPRGLIIPGHDPLVRSRFPQAFAGAPADIRRLDLGVLPGIV